VEPKIKPKRNTDKTFSITLAEIRSKLAIINACLIFGALGLHGTQIDYIVAGIYLTLNLICWIATPLKYLTTRLLRFVILLMDLGVTSFMIAETGGATSDLYPFLFIPVLLAVLRYKYLGITISCTLMAMILLTSAFFSGTLLWIMLVPLTLKITYLYLTGIIGGYLFKQMYSVKEEISKTLTRWNIDLQRLNSFSQEVTASSDLDEIFNQITKTIRQTNTAQMIAMLLFDGETLKIYDSMGWDETWIDKYHNNPLSKHSLTLAPIIVFKEPLLCPSIRKHPELVRTFEGIPIESIFAFPLVISGEVLGMLVTSSQTSHILCDQESQILTSITSQASTAIQNILTINTEKRKADTDGLTGLYNRRYFNERIEWLTDWAIEQELPLSLILIDIDNFKKYNDTYGHPAGDQLLKVMTTAITEVLREHDIFARYGGEEFVVILKDTNNKLAIHIAERIRQAVTEIPTGVLKCPITISVGVGTLPDQANDRVSLLDFVDKSLYYAKNNGKNRVCCGYK
jgi:diguanylate cyclase (GGDEF)-like protein